MTHPSKESYREKSYLVCYNGVLRHPIFGYGLCECGCGGKPVVSKETCRIFGYIRGEPRRFIHGHQSKNCKPDYELKDCGFPQGPCWIWKKLLDPHGYARITIHGKNRRATHSYFAHFRSDIEILEGYHLDHLCRIRACVNPWHLEPVPPAVNVRRGERALYTEDDIRRMIEMRKTGMLYKDIGKYFGAKVEYVQAICKGERWSGIVSDQELPKVAKRMNQEEINHIVSLRMSGIHVYEISQRLKIPQQNIFNILRRRGLGRNHFGRRKKIRLEE